METLNPGEQLSETFWILNTDTDELIEHQPYENHPLYSILYKLSVDELKERCKKNSISGFSKLKKAEIVNLITKNFINKFNYNSSQLSSLKLDELKAFCKHNNLSGYSSLKKDELISFITVNNIIKSIETPEDDTKSLTEIKKNIQKNAKNISLKIQRSYHNMVVLLWQVTLE
jgi:hypothetical protein